MNHCETVTVQFLLISFQLLERFLTASTNDLKSKAIDLDVHF